MTTNEIEAALVLITRLKEKGVEIWIDQQSIRYRSKIGALDEADRAQIKLNSRGLRLLLTATGNGPCSSGNKPVLLLDGAFPPLFCIHSVSGAATLYHRLNLHKATNSPPAVYGVNARGRDLSTPPHSTIEEMAESYIKEIKVIQPTGPYRLCGYSMGGMIAFEMAARLLREGEQTNFLGLIDTRFNEQIEFDKFDFWVTFANIYVGTVAPDFHSVLAATDGQSKGTIARLLYQQYQAASPIGLGHQKSFDAFEKELAFYESLYNASMTYVPPKAELDVTYFGFEGGDNARRWATRTRKVHLITIQGDHLGLFQSDATATQVGKELLRVLDS
ncbi:thioesterase domain-containing protein [Rhizobium paknamense]|uniref:Thioesterase domain-containing protein n=1 Tax=Rhizobium paknamense TaxID=1206817 RepID=A0ABU0IJB1_9HYPH|nr:thioesterase domain-containing protein [Rhizobium paknamense]MDQ0458335.1 thioesterase domain-containing protein [Rhizobium paknamense]